MPPDPETDLTKGRKSIRGTTSAQAAAHDAKQRQVKSSSGNRGLTNDRSRSNQTDYANAQAGELVKAKDEQSTGGERAGSPKKSNMKSRSRNVDSSSSLDYSGQAPVGTPIAAPVGAQAIGANPTARSSGAPAATAKASGEGKPTKPLTTYPPGCKPSTPVSSSSDPSVHLLKSSSASAQVERQKAQAAALPGPPNSRSNTVNSLPPAEGVESQERDLFDAKNVDYSDGDSNDDYGEDEDTYADARAISEKLAQEDYDALRQFQQQQQEANRQMYMQQQQLLEVAQAIAPKPSDSRSTTTMLGIGVGGSGDKLQSSKEKSLHRKILELENAWQQEKTANANYAHHYRNLWNRANAQSEELQRSQSQVHRLLDDNRSLTHELEAVNMQLADAKTLSEVRGKELKELKVDTTDVDQKDNEEEPWDMPGGSDILLTAAAIQTVDVLNVEVRRVASVLGKVLQKTKFEEGLRQSIQITEKARLMLGENMVALLSAGLPERARVDPLLVQVVLQVAIINWCKTNISSWKPGNSDVSNSLVELYSKIRQVEDPTFYHHWRSVTWAQMEFSSSGWSQDLLDGLLDIFAFARWPIPNANQKTLFEEQFPPIFNAIRDLRKALGEDITSIDIEIATIDPGTTFDSAFMDNGWPTLMEENTLEIVSGTTSLGLKKVIMKPSTEGDSLAPSADVICRPKVILERTVQEALVPPSSKAQRKGLPKRGAASGDGRG